jgi:hypothetical protein
MSNEYFYMQFASSFYRIIWKIIVLGGPAMLIGLGGGAASSINSGEQNEDLDTTHIPISGGLLISPKIAQYIRTTKFIVKASSANRTLKHNI